MEFNNWKNQYFYEVYVSSEEMFCDFEFDRYTYHCVHSKCNKGVEYSGLGIHAVR